MVQASADELIILGQVSGSYGVKGWVKVFSYTQPRENILAYAQWLLGRDGQWQSHELVDGRAQGPGIVAQLAGVDQREAADRLRGYEIAVAKDELPETAPGEYYWRDLIGLAVSNTNGVSFGRVVSMMETGANDVLVVQGERERLIPFRQGDVIQSIALDKQQMLVDWPEDF